MDKTEALINGAAAFIYKTFVVSVGQANEHASGQVDLIRAKGGDVTSFSQSELEELVTKALASRFEWRDENDRQKYFRNSQAKVDAYNAHIESGRKSPFKKW